MYTGLHQSDVVPRPAIREVCGSSVQSLWLRRCRPLLAAGPATLSVHVSSTSPNLNSNSSLVHPTMTPPQQVLCTEASRRTRCELEDD